MPTASRAAAAILADLRSLDRANDRLELRLAMVRQNLKAAEARLTGGATPYLDRAERQLRRAG